MLDAFANYFSQHPIAVAFAAIGAILILIWMTGSGSRQRFITIKRTKESEQLARDLSRIAAALEKIARQGEVPTDYLNRPIPPGWEETISAGEAVEDLPPAQAQPVENQDAPRESAEGNPDDAHHAPFSPADTTVAAQAPLAAHAAVATASAAANATSAARAHDSAKVQETSAPENFAFHAGVNGEGNNSVRESAPRENSQHARRANPLGGTANLLGKKKLDLPNPLYRPK